MITELEMKNLLITISVIFIFSNCSNSNENIHEEKFKPRINSIVKKIFLKRPTYNLEYPYNWYIDSTDSDFDIDNYFSIDSKSESGFVKFIFFNTQLDEEVHLKEQIKEHLKVTVKNGTVSYFNKWGIYTGQGAIIKGKMLGVFKGELKLFVHSNDSSSFLIFSQILDEDKLRDEQGLKIIENSFLKK